MSDHEWSDATDPDLDGLMRGEGQVEKENEKAPSHSSAHPISAREGSPQDADDSLIDDDIILSEVLAAEKGDPFADDVVDISTPSTSSDIDDSVTSSPDMRTAPEEPHAHETTGSQRQDTHTREQSSVPAPTATEPSATAAGPPDAGLRAPEETAAVSTAQQLENTDREFNNADEELVLKELVALTTAPAPFISRANQDSRRDSLAETDVVPGTSTGSASDSTSSVRARSPRSVPADATKHEAATAPPQPVKPPRAVAGGASSGHRPSSLDNEQAVLDAILDSIECQQSSVSGDLTEESPSTESATGPGRWREGLRLTGRGEAQHPQTDDTEDVQVQRVLAYAEAVASSSLLVDGGAPPRRGDCVLSFHEHAALSRALRPSRSSFGRPTCVALRPLTLTQSTAPPAAGRTARREAGVSRASAERRSRTALVHMALGTSLGAVMLCGERWEVLGVCGSADANSVAVRGGVVAVSMPSMPADPATLTVASGHEKGVFILWSADTLAPLRVLTDEFTSPVLVLRHLFCDPLRTLALDAQGSLVLFTFTRVMSKTMFRSTTICNGANNPSDTTSIGVSDFAVLPHPTVQYLANTDRMVGSLDRGEEPVLFCALGDAVAHSQRSQKSVTIQAEHPSDGDSVNAPVAHPFVQSSRHLVATVSSDTVLLHLCETGLYNACAAVARHTHPPTTSLSNELVCFTLVEQDTPKVLLCVSWNTEVELLRVLFDGEANVVGLESVAVTRMPSPLLAMVPVAGAGVLMLDKGSTMTLYDATVAVVVERHGMTALAPAVLTHPLCGSRFHGSLAHNNFSAFFLGSEKLFSCALLPWDERLGALLVRRKYVEALDLIQDLAEEVALCVVGLHSSGTQRRRALKRYTEAACVAYLRSTVEAGTGPDTAGAASLPSALHRVITFCCRVDELEEVFFGPVMAYLREVKETPRAFVALEGCMLQGVVTSMPEMYIDSFFHFFLSNEDAAAGDGGDEGDGVRRPDPAGSVVSGDPKTLSGAQRAERALMHIETNLECLLKLAQDHRLVKLQVSVLSLRQQRFSEAFSVAVDGDKLLSTNASTPCVGENAVHSSSSVALDYLECTLRGLSIVPHQELAPAAKVRAKRDVWACVVSNETVFRDLLCHSKPSRRFVDALVAALQDSDTAFSPWTEEKHALSLKYNVAKVFALLTANSTKEPEQLLFGTVTDPVAASAAPSSFKPWELSRRDGWPLYEETVHLFLSALVDGMHARPQASLAACLGTVGEWASLTALLVAHFTYMFQTAQTAVERRRMQDQLTTFLHCVRGNALGRDVPLEPFAAVFQGELMARCLATVYCSAAQYSQAIDCYLDRESNRAEPQLARGVFDFLRSEMLRLEQQSLTGNTIPTDDNVDAGNKRKRSHSWKRAIDSLRRAVMDKVDVLVQVDATALAQLVFDFLPSENDDVMRVLRTSSRTFLLYLDELMAKGDLTLASDVNVQNTYIELLCAHEPERVYDHLKTHDSSISYDVQVALSAVRKHRVADAAVFLLGKTLMVEEAVHTLFEAIRAALRALHNELLLAKENQAVEREAASTVPEGGVNAKSAEATSNRAKTGSSAGAAGEAASGEGYAADLLAGRTVEHLLIVGVDMLSALRAQSPHLAQEPWFLLLDVFTAPRRALSAWQSDAEKSRGRTSAAASAATDGASPFRAEVTYWRELANEVDAAARLTSAKSTGGSVGVVQLPQPTVVFTSWTADFLQTLLSLYTKYIAELLRTMVRELDLSLVLSKVVQDREGEALGPFKPIIVDMMSAIRFDLEVKRLCQQCVEEDLVELGGQLYHNLNSGIIALSDQCYLCHRNLSDNPPSRSTLATVRQSSADGDDTESADPTLTSGSVCIFACGHGFHDACRAVAATVDGRLDCVQCFVERAGAARRERYRFIAEAAQAAVVQQAQGVSSHARARGRVAVPSTTVEATRDTALMARRLRQTKSKIDGNDDAYSVLRGFLAASSVAVPGADGGAAASAGPDTLSTAKAESSHVVDGTRTQQRTLLRAPAPQLPVTLQQLGSKEPLDLTAGDSVINKLSDAEILELFDTF